MAGSYPDAPGRRIAYHEDGTVAWYAVETSGNFEWGNLSNTSLVYMTPSQAQTLNNEAEDILFSMDRSALNPGTTGYVALVFPEPRDLYGWYVHLEQDTSSDSVTIEHVQWSANSTNGIDGDWTEILDIRTENYNETLNNFNRFRTAIDSMSATAARSIRWLTWDTNIGQNTGSDIIAFHVYGSIATGETPDRILFIDNDTGLEFTEVHDWGDVPRGTTLDKEIKLKNNSATLAASSIALSFDALTGTSDTWYTLSDSGGAFGTTLNIAGPVAAGASYPAADVIKLRLTVADDEGLSLQSAYLKALVGSWA